MRFVLALAFGLMVSGCASLKSVNLPFNPTKTNPAVLKTSQAPTETTQEPSTTTAALADSLDTKGTSSASAPALAKSSKTAEQVPIVPTTGVFSDADEDLYNVRYDAMVEAFASGQSTTNYDTEIVFGETLSYDPLPRRGSQSLPSDVIEILSQYAEDNNSDSFMIFEDGYLVAERYFGTIDSETLINAKSLAKPLGVIAVGRAIKRGFIDSLDQPVSDFIIEWQGTEKAAITIRHLLDMRSGLLPQGRATTAEDVLNRAYLHPRHDAVIIHEYPLVDPPGSRYEYSNANSELVSVIIERATSRPYPDWLANEVLSPLGARGGKIWMNREGGTAHSGCCVGLPSEVYLKLGVLVLQKGEWDGQPLLTRDFVDQMLTATPQNKYSGMGLYLGRHYKKFRGATNPDATDGFPGTLHSEPYIDTDIALFDGNGNQVVYIMPARDMVIMRLGARPKSPDPWDNAFIPNTVSRALDEP